MWGVFVGGRESRERERGSCPCIEALLKYIAVALIPLLKHPCRGSYPSIEALLKYIYSSGSYPSIEALLKYIYSMALIPLLKHS